MTKTLKTMALTVLLATAVLGQTAQAKALTQTAQGVTGYTQTAKAPTAGVETVQAIRAAKAQSDYATLGSVKRLENGSFEVGYTNTNGEKTMIVVVAAQG
ncbi:MAG: hypothetical protein HOI33_06390 [Rhodospirillaceae bacterium]|jgi:hypothetical protein|nr:hypothetical protein [Rhodospirillaceae bacterium]MBT5752321.1 hypothetical protein [Rhodospirillaceae bacterium]